MAWRHGRFANWLDHSTHSGVNNVFGHSDSDSVGSSTTFGQLLTQLNSAQTQVQARSIAPSNHWQPNSQPDQQGTLTVTSDSTDGFVTDATVTAHVSDPDGVRWRTVKYQWLSGDGDGNWTPIAGATSASFKLTSDYLGKQIDVTATYVDRKGHFSTVSDPFTVTPANTTPEPQPSQPDHPGQLVLSPNSGYASGVTVQATVSDADGVDVTTEKFQWRVSQSGQWQDITNATTNSLNLTDALAGKNVELVVSYDDQAGHSATLTQTFSVASLPPPQQPANLLSTVAILSPNGLNEGSTITANVSDGDGFVPNNVNYTWQDNVSGTWQNVGTGQTHTIGFAEGGHDIRVLASYTDNTGHAENPQSSAVHAADVDRPGTLTVASSTGGFAENATITASVTDPDGITPGSVHYQWSWLDGSGHSTAISGATSASYMLTAADAGKQVDVVATYVDLQGHHDSAADPFTVAASPSPPPSGTGGGSGTGTGATILWSAEFDTPLDLKSASNPHGLWAPVDIWQDINSGGWKDFSGTNWNLNPNNPTFAPYNPFSVENGYLQIEAFRTPAELVGPIQQEMNKQGTSGPVPDWIGGQLITNKDDVEFTYGYFEFRERIVNPGKGMFPALWFYSAEEANDPQGKPNAEIDLSEIFGDPNTWYTTLHPGGNLGADSVDPSGWHTYGMLWEPNQLQFYRDGQLLYTATTAQASYFNDLKLAIRVDFAMDAPWFAASAHSDSTTTSMQMQIDYIRQYSALPFQTGTG